MGAKINNIIQMTKLLVYYSLCIYIVNITTGAFINYNACKFAYLIKNCYSCIR